MSSSELHQRRMTLIPIRAELREVQRYQAAREAELALSIEGKNAEERKARLTLSLANDEQYTRMQEDVERLQAEIEAHEGVIEHLRDLRRDHEWGIRLRLAAALDGRGLPAEERPDEAFDTVADDSAIGAIQDRYDELDAITAAQGSPVPYRPATPQSTTGVAVAQAQGAALGTLDEAFVEKYTPPYVLPPRRNQPQPVTADEDIEIPF